MNLKRELGDTFHDYFLHKEDGEIVEFVMKL